MSIALLFFQYDEKTEEPGRNGWLLLSALNLLGAEGDSYAEVSYHKDICPFSERTKKEEKNF